MLYNVLAHDMPSVKLPLLPEDVVVRVGSKTVMLELDAAHTHKRWKLSSATSPDVVVFVYDAGSVTGLKSAERLCKEMVAAGGPRPPPTTPSAGGSGAGAGAVGSVTSPTASSNASGGGDAVAAPVAASAPGDGAAAGSAAAGSAANGAAVTAVAVPSEIPVSYHIVGAFLDDESSVCAEARSTTKLRADAGDDRKVEVPCSVLDLRRGQCVPLKPALCARALVCAGVARVFVPALHYCRAFCGVLRTGRTS